MRYWFFNFYIFFFFFIFFIFFFFFNYFTCFWNYFFFTIFNIIFNIIFYYFIYVIKYVNTTNKKDLLRNKFYELLDVIKNHPEKEKEIFSKLDIDTSLYLIFEILHSNPNPNLNADDIKNNPSYSEKDFENDLDQRYKPIIDLVIEHLKKMLNEKRIQLSVACNFINKGLLNFDFEEVIESRLLIVLEKKLKKKKNQPNLMSNTFSGGFNLNTNILNTNISSHDKKMMSSNNFNISNIE